MKSPEFSFRTREDQIAGLPGSAWEVLVIGGGILGAACARDLALRGVSCLLLESQDFASGTSSGSSKLIHGGLRYLEQKEFKLVYKAIQERERLKHLYAPFVQDIDFVFPTYKKVFPSRWLLHIGLSLYDAFSHFRKRHRHLNREEVLKNFPYIKSEDLTGGVIYQDSFAEDYRLVIELVKSAYRHGATCINRVRVEGFEEKQSPFQVKLRDQITGREIPIRANQIINCSGPFSDQVREMLRLPPCLHLTQGVHFIVPHEKLPIDKAFVMSDPNQNRILFAIPWNSVSYIGTTDTDIRHPEEAKAMKEDLRYVLSIVARYFKLPLSEKDIIQSWTAVRPLIRPDSPSSNSDISRDHQIEENPKSFFHILGGKLTSHRLIAEEAVDLVAKKLGISKTSQTKKIPLQDEFFRGPADERLQKTFGHFASDVEELNEEHQKGKRITRNLPHLTAELLYSIHYEMALEPLDFLRRRSSIYYENPSIEIAEATAQVFKQELHWTDEKYEEILFKTFESYRKDKEAFTE